MVFSALWSWLAAVVVATVGYAIATGLATPAAFFGVGFGIGWFGLLIPALAAVVGSLAALVARGRSIGHGATALALGARRRGVTDAARGAPADAADSAARARSRSIVNAWRDRSRRA